MVFNITFTVFSCVHGDAFANHTVCFCKDTCEILMVDTERWRESICAAMCPTEGHGEVPGILSCNSINSVNTTSLVRWIGSLLWFATASLLALIVKILVTVIFSVYPQLCVSYRTHYTHIYKILIGNKDKGTPIIPLTLWTLHALPISVHWSAVINVWCHLFTTINVVEIDICF